MKLTWMSPYVVVMLICVQNWFSIRSTVFRILAKSRSVHHIGKLVHHMRGSKFDNISAFKLCNGYGDDPDHVCGAGRVCMGYTGVSARQNLYLNNFKEKPSCTRKVFIFLVVLFSLFVWHTKHGKFYNLTAPDSDYVTNYKERLNTLRKTTSNMRLKPLEVRWVLTSENFAC